MCLKSFIFRRNAFKNVMFSDLIRFLWNFTFNSLYMIAIWLKIDSNSADFAARNITKAYSFDFLWRRAFFMMYRSLSMIVIDTSKLSLNLLRSCSIQYFNFWSYRSNSFVSIDISNVNHCNAMFRKQMNKFFCTNWSSWINVMFLILFRNKWMSRK